MTEKQDLETQTRLAEDRHNQLKYLQADFDNYRKLEGEERARLAVIEEFSEDAILAKTLDGSRAGTKVPNGSTGILLKR